MIVNTGPFCRKGLSPQGELPWVAHLLHVAAWPFFRPRRVAGRGAAAKSCSASRTYPLPNTLIPDTPHSNAMITGFINELNGDGPYDYLSHTTVQNFILRIGLYLLQRDTLFRHDWIWIIDHSYSVGTTKVFLVLGIRLTDFRQLRRPLQHHDLEVLMLLPVEQSNGDIVHRQLSDLAIRVGIPLAILSDRGSDLHKGVALLQQDQPDGSTTIMIAERPDRREVRLAGRISQQHRAVGAHFSDGPSSDQ